MIDIITIYVGTWAEKICHIWKFINFDEFNLLMSIVLIMFFTVLFIPLRNILLAINVLCWNWNIYVHESWVRQGYNATGGSRILGDL